MTEYLPLIILAAGAVFAGLIPFGEYVSSDGRVFALHTDWAFSVLPLTLSIGGILIATWMYLKQNERSDRAAAFFAGFYRAARSKFFLDELYGFVTKKIIFRFIGAPAFADGDHVVVVLRAEAQRRHLVGVDEVR